MQTFFSILIILFVESLCVEHYIEYSMRHYLGCMCMIYHYSTSLDFVNDRLRKVMSNQNLKRPINSSFGWPSLLTIFQTLNCTLVSVI